MEVFNEIQRLSDYRQGIYTDNNQRSVFCHARNIKLGYRRTRLAGYCKSAPIIWVANTGTFSYTILQVVIYYRYWVLWAGRQSHIQSTLRQYRATACYHTSWRYCPLLVVTWVDPWGGSVGTSEQTEKLDCGIMWEIKCRSPDPHRALPKPTLR